MSNSVSNVTNTVVSMLLEHSLKSAAVAVQKAVGVVTAKEAGSLQRFSYSPHVNRYLCEALFFVNSLPKSNNTHKAYLKRLIESYREVNGITGTSDIDTVHVDEICEGLSVANEDMAAYILDETAIGEEYNVSDISNDYYGHGELDESDPEVVVESLDISAMGIAEVQDDIISCLNECVSLGYFSILERDEVTGQMTVVKRIA